MVQQIQKCQALKGLQFKTTEDEQACDYSVKASKYNLEEL